MRDYPQGQMPPPPINLAETHLFEEDTSSYQAGCACGKRYAPLQRKAPWLAAAAAAAGPVGAQSKSKLFYSAKERMVRQFSRADASDARSYEVLIAPCRDG